MISFNNLGRHGRLGNQMFQYATLKSIAMKHGYEFAIPPSNFNNSWTDHQLFEAFELYSLPQVNIKYNQTEFRFSERYFHYDEDFYKKCPDNIDIFGYFQSEKYFLDFAEDIKNDFIFKENILNLAKEFRTKIETEDVISLHIRRTDYLNNPGHQCCTLEYYQDAISKLDPYIPIIIFTDDYDWCLDQNIFKSERFYISQKNSNLFDMCLMTLCNYHIIANSSFSWWGAWLSNSKKVIAPKKWFGPLLENKNNIKDLIPDRWTKI